MTDFLTAFPFKQDKSPKYAESILSWLATKLAEKSGNRFISCGEVQERV